MSTRRIVITGVLAAIAIILGLTGWGFIPVPNVSGSATIMHVPAIIGGVLEGNLVGLLVGGIFGVFSWLQAQSTGNALFTNPLVSVVPRLFIGVVASRVYRALRSKGEIVALAVSGIFGTLTNTILVVGALILFGLIPAAVVPTLIPQIIAEVIIATVITVAVVAAWKRIDRGAGRSSSRRCRPSASTNAPAHRSR